jgi:hypothetical protein
MHRYHDTAMDLADKADRARRNGDATESKRLLTEAFCHERDAAMEFDNVEDMEPTRSVLFRSAASLAFEAGLLEEARIMAVKGLYGLYIREDIAKELQDILDQIGVNKI